MKHAAALFGVALLARIALLALRPFDGLYGQDAFAYYNYALSLRDSLMQGQPLPAFFWPIGFPLHVVALMGVIGPSPLPAQLVSVIAGAAVAPLTYALTREALIDRDRTRAQIAAVVAGLIVAVGGQLMISSLSIMSDATALMWATASAWLTLHYARTLTWPLLLLAVFALSLAVITRWIMALVAVPWTVAVLLAWRGHWPQIGWRRAAVMIAGAALIGGVIVGGQLWSGSHTGDLQVVGWDPLNAVRNEVHNSDGVFQYGLPMAVFYAQPLIHPAYVFPLFLPLLLIGLWSLRNRPSSTRAVLIGWPLMIYGFLAGIAWQNPRFALSLLPPLAVWVALGFDWVQERDRRWRTIAAILIGLSLIGLSAWSVRVVDNFVARKDADLAVVHQLDRLVPPDGTLIAFGLTATAQHYTDLRVIELYYLDETALGREIQSGQPLYLLIDRGSIEQQWQTMSPAINYRWLQAHTRLKPVATLTPYQLFRVDRLTP
jgi:hypothetical protein